MALLREQRNFIKAVYNIRESKDVKELTKGQKVNVEAFIGIAHEGEILVHVLKHPIFLDEKIGRFPTRVEDKDFYCRSSKLGVLLQSCLDAGFLINVDNPVAKSSEIPHFKITDRGTDLLHVLGFIQITFDKYSKIIVFFWGVLAVLAVKVITWIIGNWNFFYEF
jgi:hypothetical protein